MASDTVTLRPVTIDMLGECLTSMELTFGTFGEHGLCLPFRQHYITFTQQTQASSLATWVAHSNWNRKLNIAHMPLAKNTVQAHNATSFAPHIWLVVPDDGFIYFSMSWTFGWSIGATPQQVTTEINMAIAAISTVFDALNSTFPDSWTELEDAE
ncbi:MAG: hypothetical protein Q4P71_04595 [Actinomycetaceae bacterium]|nr:hypothetical protein [Actinomycetaceae bacterium]